MGKIRQLSSDIIARIAAGEVIERPAFAVKELIENSIDANAANITILIEESGLRKIHMVDDGEGMEIDDLQMAIQSHTTSKLHHDTLIGIKSLGFRGEALASIASVSDLVLQSRTRSNIKGMRIEVSSGKIISCEPVGMPIGTQVIASHLFTSVPVRKNFLKQPKTEFHHILDIYTNIALSFPHIGFTVVHNGKILSSLPSKQKRDERIRMLIGSALYNYFLPVFYEDAYISISGYIATPHVSVSNSKKQFLFINNRVVANSLISLAVKEAYSSLLNASSSPVFVLFLSLPFEMVDVNVHPRKEQVRFLDKQLVFDVVQKAILTTLHEQNLSYRTNIVGENESISDEVDFSGKRGGTDSFAGDILKKDILQKGMSNLSLSPSDTTLQIHALYIITQTEDGFTAIDQHAAHERVLFETYVNSYLEKKKIGRSHVLQKPLILDLSLTDIYIIEENLDLFSMLGFSIHKHNQEYVVTELPYLLKDRNITQLLLEIIAEIASEHTPKSIDSKTHRMLAYIACRSAIKRGEILNKTEQRNLLLQLQKTKNNVTCPHGRPTYITVDIHQIDHLFRRS